jgi:hypothetical protein
MVYNVLKFNIVDDEIEAVIAYYEAISINLGIRVENEILSSLLHLKNHAHNYLLLPDNIHRRIPVQSFPYMFIYSIENENVIVKMLFPQKDDPAKLWERLIS